MWQDARGEALKQCVINLGPGHMAFISPAWPEAIELLRSEAARLRPAVSTVCGRVGLVQARGTDLSLYVKGKNALCRV